MHTAADPDTISPAGLARLVALHLRLSGADADEAELVPGTAGFRIQLRPRA